MKILLIDNYDSFTYNLAQYLGELGVDLEVRRNDEITLAEIDDLAPDGIVISPGPGVPSNSGISMEVVSEGSKRYPILGVCLGHQAICEAFGGRINNAPSLVLETGRIIAASDVSATRAASGG